jgi:hypothetical protein
MSWREDLNLRRHFFSSARRQPCGGVEQGLCDFCPILSDGVDGGRTVLLPVLLSVCGGRFGGTMCVAIHYVNGQKRFFGNLLEPWDGRAEAHFCSHVSNGVHPNLSILLSSLLTA